MASKLRIGELSARTGVLPVTLRAWETRYGLLKPERLPKGHRLYDRSDVARVKQIKHWLGQGVPLRQIPARLAGQGQEPAAASPHGQLLALAQTLRSQQLRQALSQLFKETPLALLLDELFALLPNWPDTPLGQAGLALFEFELARQLSRFHWSRQQPRGQAILAGALPPLWRSGAVAVLGRHYQLLDLGTACSAGTLRLASQALGGVPVFVGRLAQAADDWQRIGPPMTFTELQQGLP
ncbi:MerR family transcriptional regulator [Gallaecimonas sp. GXIMD4217]|uniref:MerR family transcriptional regulator n=1 Tax=Gallaecimonas sp. GXIMD4217 TaxID=3131927 RepID=UPI00311AF7B1